ncbi:MAG TPA: helix-turn-helix transcriptional regulator [Thermoanaerobaculia bacterium]|nr:helix-turn-helix transcriptional regulator [Thermoanaerobaculia bacterium]
MPRTTSHPPPPLGIVLRHLREEAGWTQTQLEAAAGLGPTAVTKLERGIHHLSRSETERLVRILGYPEGWVARTLAVVEQLPRFEAMEDSPAALTPAEYLAVETAAFDLWRNFTEAARRDFGAALRAKRWQADRKAAGKAWKRFRRQEKDEQSKLIASEKDYQTWAFCERLCEESVHAASHDAGKTRKIADLALFVAERSPGGPRWRNQLLGYAWAFVGNSWKVLGDPHEAEKAMSISSDLWETEGADPSPLDRAIPLALRARLWIEQGKYVEALRLIEGAIPISGSRLTRMRLLIDKGAVLRGTGSYDSALAAYQEASQLAEEAHDQRMKWTIAFNEALCSCDLRDFQGASTRLGELRLAALDYGRSLEELRLCWLAARIAAGLGRLEEATCELDRIWQVFADRQMWWDSARAALELAAVELDRGCTRRVKTLAEATTAVFAALKLPAELLQSVQLFWDAARQEVAAAESARHLLEALQLPGRKSGFRV